MALSKNYVGKNVDLCVLETSDVPGLADVLVGLTDSGTAISGPYKVAQKFFKFLTTELGSVPSNPNYGTVFIAKLLNGQIHTSLGLSFEFYASLPDVIRFVRSSNENPTPDESLTRVVLESFNVNLDKATMVLRFTFEDSSTILVPISISTV